MSIKTAIRTDRVRLVKVIHVARRELALDDSTYRQMLQTVTGKESTTALESRELQAVVEHLKRKGFKVRRAGAAAPAGAPRQADRRQASGASARKVRALWLFLHRLDAVRDPSERALATYCKRIAKVDDLEWADGRALDRLVETMKKWAMRYLPAAIKQLAQQLAEVTDPACMPGALQAIDAAHACLQRGQGYDMHWHAWQALSDATGQPVTADLAAAAPAAGQS